MLKQNSKICIQSLVITQAFLLTSLAHGFFGGGGANVSTETTQIAFKIQNLTQHAAVIDEWNRNYQKVTAQLNALEEQLEVDIKIKDWIGDPANVELPALEVLAVEDFLKDIDYGVSWEIVIQDADGSDSLSNTHGGLYPQIEAKTVTGEDVAVNDAELKRYAVVDEQYSNYQNVAAEIDGRLAELQENQALTLIDLKNATTDSEVQKLSAIVNAQNGQIALLISEREKQYQQYTALNTLNSNQSNKTKAVSVMAQLQDQRDAYKSFQNYFANITNQSNSE